MRWGVVLWIVCVAAAWWSHSPVVDAAAAWWVDNTAPASSSHDCSSLANACTSIQAAVDRADPNGGDTIHVVSSGAAYPCEHQTQTLGGGVFINKTVVLTSYPPGSTVDITCQNDGTRAFMFEDVSVRMSGFRIRNVTAPYDAPVMCLFTRACADRHHVFTNLEFADNFAGGLSLATSFASVSGGISLVYAPLSADLLIQHNSFVFTDVTFVNTSGVAPDQGFASTQFGTNGAGAINIQLSAPAVTGDVWNNSFVFTRVTCANTFGTSFFQYELTTLIGGGTNAGAIAISINSELSTQSAVRLNSISFTDCQFDACTGGGYYGGVSPGSNGEWGAAGVSVMLKSTLMNLWSEAGLFNNLLSVTNCAFTNNNAQIPVGGLGEGQTLGAGALQFMSIGVRMLQNALNVSSVQFRSNVGATALGNEVGVSRPPRVRSTAADPALTFPAAFNSAGAVALVFLASQVNAFNSFLFTDCVFDNNTLGSEYGVSNSGGALSVYDASAICTGNLFRVERCSFTRQFGGNGGVPTGAGAISVMHDVWPGFVDSDTQYYDNSHYIAHCVFVGNRGGAITSYGNAGSAAVAYYFGGSDGDAATAPNRFDFNSCVFENNTSADVVPTLPLPDAHSGSGAIFIGGVLLSTWTSAIKIENCSFLQNSGYCGAISITTSAPGTSDVTDSLLVRNCTFRDNTSPCSTCSGGAMCLSSVPYVVNSTLIANNSAGYAGGAVHLGLNAVGAFANTQFLTNTAPFASEINSQTDDASLTMIAATFVLAPPTTAGLTSITAFNIPRDTNFTRGTEMMCPPGYSAFIATRQFGCQICNAGSYSITGGVLIDRDAGSALCDDCPFGAVCDGGSAVAALTGYYGLPQVSNRSFVACQPGFCCPEPAQSGSGSDSSDDSNSCPYTDICQSAISHRTGTLCSVCESGYSEVYGSVVCRASDRCTDGVWFVMAAALMGALIACIFFYSDPRNDGLVSTLVYYYQMIPLYLVSRSSSVDVVTATVSNLFNFRFPADSGAGICPFPDIDPIGKQLISFLLPVIIGVPLLIIWQIHARGWSCDDRIRRTLRALHDWVCVRCCCRTERPALSSPIDDPFLASSPHLPMIDVSSTSSRIASSVSQLFLYSFSAVVQTLFLLLQCVNVTPAGAAADQPPTSRLFISPDAVACYSDWQSGLFVVVAAVMLSPPLMALWIARASDSDASTSAAVMVLSSPFGPHAVYWESVRLMWRLLLISVSTFVLNAVTRGLTLTIISIGILILHIQYQPMSDPFTQRLGTLCLAVLSVLGPLNAPVATTIQNASVVQHDLTSTFQAFATFQTVALLVPAVVGVPVMIHRKWARFCRSPPSAKNSDDDERAASVVIDRYRSLNSNRPKS